MPSNFGTTSTFDDPRTAYVPRNINGLTAYWNATRGQNMDFQTGNPLTDRLSALQAGQPPSGAGMIYGDSYGGIQGVEEARAAKNAQIAMQLAQMRQFENVRQRAMDDANRRFAAQMDYRDALLGQQARFADAKNRLAAENLALRREAEMGKNARAADYAQMRFDLADQANANKNATRLRDIGQAGSDLANQWAEALTGYNTLKSEIDDASQGVGATDQILGEALASGKIAGTPFGYSATNPANVPLAEMANKFSEARRSAVAKQKELNQIVADMDKLKSQGAALGFQIDPRGVVHTETGGRWGINFQAPPPARTSKAEDPEDAYLRKFGRPVVAPSGIAKYGGTYR